MRPSRMKERWIDYLVFCCWMDFRHTLLAVALLSDGFSCFLSDVTTGRRLQLVRLHTGPDKWWGCGFGVTVLLCFRSASCTLCCVHHACFSSSSSLIVWLCLVSSVRVLYLTKLVPERVSLLLMNVRTVGLTSGFTLNCGRVLVALWL